MSTEIIKNRKYLDALFDICFANSDAFSLTYVNAPQKSITLQNKLKTFILGEIVTTKWFCYQVTEKNQLHIVVYKSNDSTSAIMKKYYPGMFCSDLMGEGISWDQNAEDVCFFKNGKLILGTVSHERICYAFPSFESSFEKKLQNILNGWTVSGDLEEEQINLKKYNLAYGTL